MLNHHSGVGMDKKTVGISVLALIITLLFAGTTLYLSKKLAERDSEITNLREEIAGLKFQLSNPPNILTALGSNEIGKNYLYRAPFSKNYLWITGSVRNTGDGIAYNAGLHVVGYDTTGELLVNMTVPLGEGTFGTTAETVADLKSTMGICSSTQLGNLEGRM